MGFAIRFRGTAEQGLDVGSRENESRIDRKMSSVVWAADPTEEVLGTFAMPGSAAQRNLRRREKHRFELYLSCRPKRIVLEEGRLWSLSTKSKPRLLVQSDTLEFWLLQVDICYVVVTNYYILMCRRLRFWTLLETSGQTFLGLPRCLRCPCHLRASVISPQRTSSFVSFSRLIMTTIDFFGLEK